MKEEIYEYKRIHKTEISGTPTPEETVTPTPSEKAEKGADA